MKSLWQLRRSKVVLKPSFFFSKSLGGSEPHVQNFFKLCQKLHLILLIKNSVIRKNFTLPFLKYKRLKLKLRVFLAGHSIAMVTYCVTKIIPTCSPVIGQFFDTMIVASTDEEWL